MNVKVIRDKKDKDIHYEYDPSSRPLGEGGMGVVYRGWQFNESSGSPREVAIKELKMGLEAHVIERARREANVRLKNDNLIEMIDFLEVRGKDELGLPVVRYYVISEFLHGVTLEKLLEGRVTDYEGVIIPYAQQMHGQYLSDPYHFALNIIRSLLSGLMALHDAGYIHRDIDPSNIMVTSDGHVKLIDFGIAKDIRGKFTDESSYTLVGQIIGKPKYAAPEQLQGIIDALGVPTDLYSVGIVLYQLVVGHVPFDGEMAIVLDMQRHKKVPLGEVKQAELRKVIRKATQKDRAQRYQSASEFRVAVDRLVSLPYPDKKVNMLKAGIAAAVVAVAGLAVWYFAQPASAPANGGVAELATQQRVKKGHSEDASTDKELFAQAVGHLKQKDTARQGWELLNRLAASSSAEVSYAATFLMSRLYFSNEADAADVADSIRVMQQALSGIVQPDNRHAHELLLKAVEQNGNDYRSLYELGCNYMSREKRGVAKDLQQAESFLQKAESLAVQAGDTDFQNKIRKRLSNLE